MLRQQHVADAQTLLPDHWDWGSWSADRLQRMRQQRLQALLVVARERSPWHQRRLAGIDPGALDESELVGIPPMTKADLMENWDDIVTDRRLNLDLVKRHLGSVTADRYCRQIEWRVEDDGDSPPRTSRKS